MSVDTSSIPKKKGVRIIVSKNFNTEDIIKLILDRDALLSDEMSEFSSQFEKSYDGLYDLWEFVNKNIRYSRDKKEWERVKDPWATWTDRYGDCKSFSLFVGSVLKCMGVKYFYRFAAYPDTERKKSEAIKPTHIYVVAELRGKKIIMDTTYSDFDKEGPYLKKWDKMPTLEVISGHPQIRTKRARPTLGQMASDGPNISISPNVDGKGKTQGEIKLGLLDAQLQILSSYYGDPNGNFQTGRNVIHNALNIGIENYSIPSSVPEEIFPLLAELQSAKNRHIQELNFEYKNSDLISGFSKKIGSAASEIEKCIDTFHPETASWYFRNVNFRKGKNVHWIEAAYRGSNDYFKLNNPDFKECWRKALARSWSDQNNLFNSTEFKNGAYHLLYNFFNPNKYNNATVGAKQVIHDAAVGAFSNVSGYDFENVKLFIRNHIMSKAGAIKIPDVTPEGSIEEMSHFQDYAGNPEFEKVGDFGLTAAIAIITAVTAAIAEMNKLLGKTGEINQATIRGASAGIGQKTFGPQKTDWTAGTGSDGSGFSLTSALPFIAIGGLALFLSTRKK